MFFSYRDENSSSSGAASSAARPHTTVQVSPENRVTVLVWLPKVDKKPTEAKQVLSAIREAHSAGRRADVNIGHVTLSTPNQYASLWPAESTGGDKYKVVKAAYKTFSGDVGCEGGFPDTIVHLYSLDVAAIEAAFTEIQSSDTGFVLAGDTSIVRSQNDQKGYNCNGLVYELLKRGGVDRITPFASESRFILYISPDKFNAYIREVKSKELSLHPETKTYPSLVGEYIPTSKQTCTML